MTFEASFDFGQFRMIVKDEGVGWLNVWTPGGAAAITLKEAIPQLRLVLETAKIIVNKEAQEATDGE